MHLAPLLPPSKVGGRHGLFLKVLTTQSLRFKCAIFPVAPARRASAREGRLGAEGPPWREVALKRHPGDPDHHEAAPQNLSRDSRSRRRRHHECPSPRKESAPHFLGMAPGGSSPAHLYSMVPRLHAIPPGDPSDTAPSGGPLWGQ